MSLVDDLLPVIDLGAGIIGQLGLSPTAVNVIVTTWTGTRAGQGTGSTVSTPLLVGGQNPGVRRLKGKEIVALGLQMEDEVYQVGPLTPPFTGGGIAPSVFSPTVAGSPTQVQFELVGAMGTVLCTKIGQDLSDPLGYTLLLQTTGRKT